MLRTILVPLDGSRLAERALEYATAIAVPTAARLILMRTVAETEARHAAERYLNDTAFGLRQRGFDCDTATPVGSAADWIVAEAESREVDLVAMSTHGRTGPGRWLFGSIAESVVASCQVPVLVGRAWQPIRRAPLLTQRPTLLVPLDGSAFAESALWPACRLADDLGGELVLLRVEARATDVLRDEFGRTIAYLDQQDKQARELAADYLNRAANGVRTQWPGLPVHTDTRLGTPAACIAEAAISTQAAMVFMATHGRTGLQRTVMGSVAGQVLEHGTTPLVLLRPAAAATAASGQPSAGSASHAAAYAG
ncbi:MAG TPA: universal stress protein [Chloroflexota bacterium]|nr:universal stress protein [Chloroflexota bacterium]